VPNPCSFDPEVLGGKSSFPFPPFIRFNKDAPADEELDGEEPLTLPPLERREARDDLTD